MASHGEGGRPRSTVAIAILCTFALVGLADRGAAQVLTGRVTSGDTAVPLEDVALTLLHPDGHALTDPVPSGADGRFSIEVPGPGSYYLRADLIGYTSVVDGIFDFAAEDGRMNVEVFLLPEPIEIEGVDVRVELAQIRRNLRTTGFYERATAGFGDFVPPEEIEERMAFSVSDYLRNIPGVYPQGGQVLFRGSGLEGGFCEPVVFVDGLRLINGSQTSGGAGPGDGLDDRVQSDQVVAIEVYRRLTTVPFQYMIREPGYPFCGAIVIWTKTGR